MKKFFKDFKAFISRGNIVDMAVGVIIGGAFGAIITSLVNDIIMPLIVRLCDVQSLASLSIVLVAESAPGAGDALTWNYGNFLAAILNFLIIALVIFAVLRLLMRASGHIKPKYGANITEQEYKAFIKEGKSKEDIKKIDDERQKEKDEAARVQKELEEAESEKALLKRCVELLASIEAKENNKSQSKKNNVE